MAFTLGILTTLWKRPELTDLVLGYYEGIENRQVRLERVAVHSDRDNGYIHDRTRRHPGWSYYYWSNKPLGTKWNIGLAQLRDRGVDAVLIIGSDDLLSASYFDRVIRQLLSGADYITVRDAYIFDALEQRLVYAHSAMPGPGRVISRRVLDQVGWKLWDDEANYLLDGSLQASLRGVQMKNHHIRGMLDEDFAVLDIKTDVNMWALEGDRLVGAGGREMRFRKVTEVAPEPFFRRYFPGQAEQLLNWNLENDHGH